MLVRERTLVSLSLAVRVAGEFPLTIKMMQKCTIFVFTGAGLSLSSFPFLILMIVDTVLCTIKDKGTIILNGDNLEWCIAL